MRVTMATDGGAVLLDGAGIPGTESLCSHGVAWYTHRLGGALLGRLSRDDGQDLPTILAAAIGEIADDHRDTCDITNISSPQATVTIVRVHRGRLDHLVLGDSWLVLDQVHGGPQAVTDGREVAIRRVCTAPLAGVPVGTPAYDRIRWTCAEAIRDRRNQPGGYWMAKDDPRAATEAVTGSRSVSELNGVALLSNGASRIVDPYGLTDWPGALALLDTDGPADIISRVRQFETRNPADPDDVTVVYCADLAR